VLIIPVIITPMPVKSGQSANAIIMRFLWRRAARHVRASFIFIKSQLLHEVLESL
jgi:hypothetical protein